MRQNRPFVSNHQRSGGFIQPSLIDAMVHTEPVVVCRPQSAAENLVSFATVVIAFAYARRHIINRV
jgi:hypothetical protein